MDRIVAGAVDSGAVLATGSQAAEYNAASIAILSDREAVRRNPSMYVGSDGQEGLHHLLFELVDNAVDEAVVGFCRNLSVDVFADGACAVEDDGRGIPVDLHPDAGRPACEILLTTLHSGGKFSGRSYGTSAGLHGIGMSCVNALAEELSLDVWREGGHFRQTFAAGLPITDLARLGDSTRRGSRIWFRPDPVVMSSCEFSAETIATRLEEIAFLHPELHIRYRDHRTGQSVEFAFDSGVRGLLERRAPGRAPIPVEPIVVSTEEAELSVDVALRWTDSYSDSIWSFVNTVRTEQGGAHVDGLRAGVAGAVHRYALDHGLLAEAAEERTSASDALEGLSAVVAIRMTNPGFDGQTKKRLQRPEVGGVVQRAVDRALSDRLGAEPELAGQIVDRMRDAARARLAARLAHRVTRFHRRRVEVDYAVYQRQFGIRSRDWHDSCTWLTDGELLAKHAEFCDVPENARMLDVCCGSGVVGASFRGKVGEMVGLDITPEMVQLASTRLDKVYQGTVYDLPFEDQSFDLVVNREVLHLLPQPERPLAEVFRVLRPGGQFIVGQIVPYTDVDAYWMFRIFKKKQPLLFQMFTEPSFRQLLTRAGFVDLRMEEYFLWESIDRWIDTHETTPLHRQQIRRLYYHAPDEVRAVHPFEVEEDGAVRDRWRWCVYSLRKPVTS